VARLRTDLLDKRLLAMLLETSKRLIYWTIVSGQPLSIDVDAVKLALQFRSMQQLLYVTVALRALEMKQRRDHATRFRHTSSRQGLLLGVRSGNIVFVSLLSHLKPHYHASIRR